MTAAMNPAMDEALCRSILYQALSIGFATPSELTCRRLGTPDSVAALAEAAAHLDACWTSDSDRTPLEPLTRSLTRSTETPEGTPGAEESVLESLSASYQSLFGHTARGAICPYETEYGEDTLFQKPQEMADIAGFMRAFGLVPDPASRERIDHISCELEFVAFLARKEAHAIETRDEPMREATAGATRLFLRDRLARFVPSLARQVVRENPAGFHGRLSELLSALVRADCRRLGVSMGPEMLRLRAPIDDNAPMACGSADGCPGASDEPDGEGSSLLSIGPPRAAGSD